MTPATLPAYLGPDPLAPAFARATAAGDEAARDALCRAVGPRVYVFPLFTPAACARLLAEVDRRARGAAQTAPNSMHASGAALGRLGMGELLRALRADWIAPLAARLFADVGGAELDGEHGFVAEYGAGADEELGFHVDDSAVTLNVCLGDTFSGAELYFRGLRCDVHRQTGWTPDEELELVHEVGTAVLHAGRDRHGVHPIRRGRRRNLILWCQSSAAREAARSCRPWCGAHDPAAGG